jgi:hypothetical protein
LTIALFVLCIGATGAFSGGSTDTGGFEEDEFVAPAQTEAPAPVQQDAPAN